jgi:RNA polymerase sigma-54 factor
MAFSQKLEMRQGQALVMTPQLMQAIKLLQLSNMELTAYVEQELERNPLLERVAEPDAPEPREANSIEAEAPERAASDEISAGDWAGDTMETTRAAMESRLDTNLDNVFPDADAAAPPRTTPQGQGEVGTYSEWSGVGTSGRGDDGDYNLESFVSAELSLADHLAEQLALAIPEPDRRLIGQYLIDMVDETGYLQGDLAGVAEKLGCPPSEVEAVLKIVQTFDPPGIAARSLTECLSLQLIERDRFDPAMQALMKNLELLARRDFAALRKLCGVDEEDLADMVAEVRRLNPKPGLAFGSTAVQPVVPDVFVRGTADGGWHVELNSDTLPKVLINQTYYARVARTARTDADKSFLSECMQTATWLTRSLDQRARTILKVSIELVKQQDSFLAYGVRHLKPLNLKMIADAIGMHESTVSRVTANKYIATPRGIFELKYFFTSAIAAADGGDAHSAEAVRDRIRTLIEAESPRDVLSDDTIVDRLKSDGVDIARRTVAKYREAMRIPSSVQRRREKMAMAAGQG